jgi:chaperonin GroEL (HSP60 family)
MYLLKMRIFHTNKYFFCEPYLHRCKQIKKAGCNVLLLQKSILRDAVNDLSLHFLAKMGILVVRDIERDEIEFISRATGAKPVASVGERVAVAG